MKPQLRPYQLDGIEAARRAFASGAKRVLVVLATGGGKTVLASSIIKSAASKGSKVLFLAHRRELISQASAKLSSFGVEHGIIQAGTMARPKRSVQVASVATMVNRLDSLKDVNLIFVDEAHHCAAGSYLKILEAHPGAKVIGLTATPWRIDGKGLGDIFDSHVEVATPAQLHELGFLAKVKCFTFRPIDTSGVKVTAGDYNLGALGEAAAAPMIVGDIVDRYVEHAQGKRAVLFACNIEHSKSMAAAFVSAGIASEHVDGMTPSEERAAILARLGTGETKVLCNFGVCTEGWDMPMLEVAILARPTLSEALALQMIGRVLRVAEGKEHARIHDHARLLTAFGHPYDERDFSPQRTAKKRRREVEDAVVIEGREVVRKPPEQINEAEMIEVRQGDWKQERKAGIEKFLLAFKTFSPERKGDFLQRKIAELGYEKGLARYMWASGGVPPEQAE